MILRILPALLLASVSALPLAAQQPKPKPCTAPAHRQFDFWLGEWTVTDSTDTRVVGKSSIRPAHGGCVIHERWTGAGGVTGESFNIYDAQRGVWHQTWVDTGGTLLLLEGALEDGAMTLRQSGPDGAAQRITWTPRPDGTVTQRWEVTSDGETWQTSFFGIYRRAASAGSMRP